ncbi:hypothetical protein ACEPPN_000329 [Leptodophora sp. 'Broadleaf-Isolate-01']
MTYQRAPQGQANMGYGSSDALRNNQHHHHPLPKSELWNLPESLTSAQLEHLTRLKCLENQSENTSKRMPTSSNEFDPQTYHQTYGAGSSSFSNSADFFAGPADDILGQSEAKQPGLATVAPLSREVGSGRRGLGGNEDALALLRTDFDELAREVRRIEEARVTEANQMEGKLEMMQMLFQGLVNFQVKEINVKFARIEKALEKVKAILHRDPRWQQPQFPSQP